MLQRCITVSQGQKEWDPHLRFLDRPPCSYSPSIYALCMNLVWSMEASLNLYLQAAAAAASSYFQLHRRTALSSESNAEVYGASATAVSPNHDP